MKVRAEWLNAAVLLAALFGGKTVRALRFRVFVQDIKQLGGVAEWTNAAVLKTVRPARASWVRILPPPL